MRTLEIAAFWVVEFLGVVLGLTLVFGGLWLLFLGGSPFYLLAGAAIIAISFGLYKRAAFALYTALALLAVSVLWALWEVGFDFWQLVPRLLAFIIIALIVTALARRLSRQDGRPALPRVVANSLGIALLGSLGAFIVGMFFPHPTIVAESSGPAPVIQAQAGQDSGNDWPAYGRSTAGNRFAQFDQINKSNVKDLKLAWTYHTGDLAIDGSEYQVTPLKVDNTMYLCTPLNKVIAIDPVTGKERWRFDPKLRITDSNRGWKRCRGVGYADISTLPPEDVQPAVDQTGAEQAAPPQDAATLPAACRKRIVSNTNDARLFEVDAETGKPCEDFGDHGFVNLLEGLTDAPENGSYYLTSAPLVADGVIMVGGKINDNISVGEPSGVVRGYDVRTGKLLWAWDASRGAKDSTPLPPGEHYAPQTPNF